MSQRRFGRRAFHLAALGSAASLAAPSTSARASAVQSEEYDPVYAAIAHGNRLPNDKARDATRQPQRILDFFDVKPAQRIADLQAGDGYYTELMARIVGEQGQVFCVNNATPARIYGKRLTARLEREGSHAHNVVRIDSELEELDLPGDFDRIFLIRFYHDFIWMKTDRAAFNKMVFDQLRPGGAFCVVDHHAREGKGISEGQTLHRVEAKLVREEVEAAGFVLEAESYVLRDPTDTLDFNIFANQAERRDRTDRFVYLFRKPL